MFAAALAALALVACGLAPAAQAVPQTFGSGHLDWGVKQSFRGYIEGPIAHGKIDAFSGATRNGDGTFRFPVYAGSYDEVGGGGEVRANGSVRFVGHDSGSGPELEMTIADPVLVVDGDESVLSADVFSRPMGGGDPVTYTDIELGDLSPAGLTPVPETDPDPGLAFGPAAATLTSAGAPAFALYPAGEVLDPVSVLALFGDEGEEPPEEPPPLLPPSPEKPAQPQPTVPSHPPNVDPVEVKKPVKKAKRCKKGYRKVRVKGKARCVKKKKGKAAKRKAAKKRACKAKRSGRAGRLG